MPVTPKKRSGKSDSSLLKYLFSSVKCHIPSAKYHIPSAKCRFTAASSLFTLPPPIFHPFFFFAMPESPFTLSNVSLALIHNAMR